MRPFIIKIDGEPCACNVDLSEGILSLEVYLSAGDPVLLKVDLELVTPSGKRKRKKKPAPVVETKAGPGGARVDEDRATPRVQKSGQGSSSKAPAARTPAKPA